MVAAHQPLDFQEISHGNKSQNEGSHRHQTSLQAQQTTSFRIVSHRTGEIIQLTHSLNQRHVTFHKLLLPSSSKTPDITSAIAAGKLLPTTHRTINTKTTQTPPTSTAPAKPK
jgi:hypothetical protein